MYIDKQGFKYSTEEIENAIKGSDVSFDQYVEARGLTVDRGLNILSSQRQRAEYISTLDKPLLRNISDKYPGEIQHADLSGFLDASNFVFMGNGQETRVVDFLNNSYSQYENISFKEQKITGGMGATEVGLYIDDKHVHSFDIAYDQGANEQSFYHIKEWIDKEVGPEQDPRKELVTLADEVDLAMNKVTSYLKNRSFWNPKHESVVEQELKKVFEGTNYEVEQADWYRDAITITNRHGVKDILTFILPHIERKLKILY